MSHAPKTATIADLLAHAGWAQRLARTLVRDDDPEDLVQETWMAALRAQPRLDRPLSAWLREVMRNRAANRERARGRRLGRDGAHAAALTAAAQPASPEDLSARLELQRTLAELVARLDPALREVVLLRYYDGLSSQEIAATLHVPAGTVRRRLMTALAHLRSWLDEQHAGRTAWRSVLAPITMPTTPAAFAERGPTPLALAPVFAAGLALLVGGLGVVRCARHR